MTYIVAEVKAYDLKKAKARLRRRGVVKQQQHDQRCFVASCEIISRRASISVQRGL